MQKRTVSDIAYILKNIDIDNKNAIKPIVFIGAGASISAGIPLTKEIIKVILKDYKNKPSVQRLNDEEKENYYQLMDALSPDERRELFKKFINDKKVKINITHIYLAQLLSRGYVDYVFTPNFDDLTLKASALFNLIPPVYDVSNIKDFTTTNFQNQSITFLHGQHHGQWLLNAKGELDKVKGIIPKLFNRVCNGRTWIIIGYSGEDEILDELAKFESFDNELYWIGFKENEPSDRVKEKLLNENNKNCFYVSGYDSDTFMLELHSQLGLDTPELLYKPFSFLKKVIEGIKDVEEVNENEHKEKYKNVKERLTIVNEWVSKAIVEIEDTDSVEKFKQEIIEATLKGDIEANAEEFSRKIKLSQFKTANVEYANFCNDWGVEIDQKSDFEKKEENLLESIEKYRLALEYNPKLDIAYFNLGSSLYSLAKKTSDEKTYRESFSEFKKAIEIDDKFSSTYHNWALSISDLAELNKDESLFIESFEKYKMATDLNPERKSYFNWANSILDLAKMKKDETLYRESIEKYQKAIELDPKYSHSYNNWGNAILEIARMKKDEKLFEESFEKYKKAIELDSKDFLYYNNWGNAISSLAKIKESTILYKESFEKYKTAIELNPENSISYNSWAAELLRYSYIIPIEEKVVIYKEALSLTQKAFDLDRSKSYNLSCVYALLKNKENALKFLKETLKNKRITKEHLLKDDDWNDYKKDEDFLKLIDKY